MNAKSLDAEPVRDPQNEGAVVTTRRQPPEYLPRAVGLTARLASATAIGVAFGVVTLWLQGHLDGNWAVLANSGAVWTVVAVAVAALLGRSAADSSAAGLLALFGEVAGYYWCAAPWHGIAVTQSEQLLWAAAAVVLGPVSGFVGFRLLRGSVTQRVRASLCVAGIAVGEGWYQLSVPQHGAAARVEIGLGLLVAAVGLSVSRAPSAGTRIGAVILGCLVAGGVLFAYSAPTLVL